MKEKANGGIADAVRLFDHHCHGVFRDELTRQDFELAVTESDQPPPPSTSALDSPLGVAVRSDCAEVLGLDRHCTIEDYLDRRTELGTAHVTPTMVAASGIDAMLIDTGFQPESLMGPAEMAATCGVRTYEVIRLETVAERVAATCEPMAFASSVAGALAVAAEHAVAAKSIVAYRHGLDFDPTRPTDQEVRAAAESWLRRNADGAVARLTDPVILRHLLYTAVDLGIPLQLHVGYGDSDIVLHRCNPSHLTAFLRLISGTNTPIMLLHCYPYIREAGILAQLFPAVYFDVSLAMAHSGASATTLLRHAMELAPFHKVLFASDAFGLPELFLVASRRWRRGVGRIVDEWLADDVLSVDDAERYVRMMASGNARRVYRLDAPPVLPMGDPG